MTPEEHAALLTQAQRTAVHLEQRDWYDQDDPMFAAWRSGWRPDEDDHSWREGWYAEMAAEVARGVEVRRLRVVSEPLSDYLRYEYDITFANVLAGEQVRWLPRRGAAGLLVPALDFWIYDAADADAVMVLHHWTGAGRDDEPHFEPCREPGPIKVYSDAFEILWERAVSHEDYQPR